MEKFVSVIKAGVREGISDIFIAGGRPTVFRKNGTISFGNHIQWAHKEVDALVEKMLTARQLQLLGSRLSVDLAMSVEHVRVRMNVFATTQGLSLAVRLLPGVVPTIANLNLHPCLQSICKGTSGLVLICGASGSGKSTTIAALVDEINRTRATHVITLEDPIEYRFASNKSLIEQRELGAHIPSFEQGLIDALREDPDVIVVGEIREPETIRLTLNAAESGHLVIASLHASNTEDALHRFCNSFPSEVQEMARIQLASTLSWIVVQRLVYMEKFGCRVPVLSILQINQAIKGLIRENKMPQIQNTMQMGRSEGMFSMDAYWKDYLSKREHIIPPHISFKPSAEASPDPVYHSPLLSPAVEPARMPARRTMNYAVRDAAGVPPMPQPHIDRRSDDGYYVIEEDVRLDELIHELNKSHKQD